MREEQRQERERREQWEQENAIAEVNRRIQNQMFRHAIEMASPPSQEK